MMYVAMLAVTLVCPKIEVHNESHTVWDTLDGEALDRATDNCKNIYPRSPCLVKFIKKDMNTYDAICGAKRAKY